MMEVGVTSISLHYPLDLHTTRSLGNKRNRFLVVLAFTARCIGIAMIFTSVCLQYLDFTKNGIISVSTSRTHLIRHREELNAGF